MALAPRSLLPRGLDDPSGPAVWCLSAVLALYLRPVGLNKSGLGAKARALYSDDTAVPDIRVARVVFGVLELRVMKYRGPLRL